MNIELGVLGKANLEKLEVPIKTEEGFIIEWDGHTEHGVRVHGCREDSSWFSFPQIWRNAVLVEVYD